MTRKPSEYDSAQYKTNRAELLRDSPTCHWCAKAPATTADHLVEIDRGGDSSLESMVPACSSCNSKRGAIYKNKKVAQRLQARNQINSANNEPNSENRFFGVHRPTPTPSQLSIATSEDQPGLVAVNHDEPRLSTLAPERVGSWGDLVVGMALECDGTVFMPWQKLVLDRMLSFDENDDLVIRQALTSVARQNGKTTIIKFLVLFWLVEMPKIRGTRQTIVSTSHRLDLACLLFDDLAPYLEDRFGAKISWSYGRCQATMPDGSRWFVKAPKPSIGHGMSIDLAIVDELFDVSELALDSGLVPAQRARRSPLLAMFSTAGTEASTAFLRWRENGLRLIDKKEPSPFLMLEWSPPPDVDPMLPENFGWGNPAMNHTLTPETILAESLGPDRGAFLRASCNLWISVARGWIETGRWPALEYEGEPPTTGGIIAAEVSLDDSRYFAVRANLLPDGRVVCSVAFTAETTVELWAKMLELAKDQTIKFAISPTIDQTMPPSFERRRIIVGYAEILRMTPVVKTMISEGRLVHTGETMLAEHVQRAVLVKTQGSIAVSSQKSPGPIELCRCLIWAAALASRSGAAGKPSLTIVAS